MRDQIVFKINLKKLDDINPINIAFKLLISPLNKGYLMNPFKALNHINYCACQI